MSLQGTLDTFGLHDVLALLSSTKKKGELRITGPGFTGSVWMDEGKLVGAEVPRCPTLVDAVFELLRLPNGEFSFEAESPTRVPMSAQAIGDVLSDAEDRMIEWRDIQVHIPSVHTKLRLAPASPSSQVVLDPEQWQLVVASALGASLAELSEYLGVGEFEISRTAKYLVENGYAVAEPVEAPASVPVPAPAKPEPAPAKPEPAAEAAPTPPPAPKPSPPQQQPAPPRPAPAQPAPAAPAEQPAAAQTPPPPAVEETGEPEAPTAAESGEPVDRSALLKFLSSVRN